MKVTESPVECGCVLYPGMEFCCMDTLSLCFMGHIWFYSVHPFVPISSTMFLVNYSSST